MHQRDDAHVRAGCEQRGWKRTERQAVDHRERSFGERGELPARVRQRGFIGLGKARVQQAHVHLPAARAQRRDDAPVVFIPAVAAAKSPGTKNVSRTR